MKKLFATIAYSFDNFYNNLNSRGQMIFSIIILLILFLCVVLFVSHIIQVFNNHKKITKMLKLRKTSKQDKAPSVIETKEKKDQDYKYQEEQTQIEDIASSIEKALKEETPITLTNFEEDQEKTAIISIDELMRKAKELDLIEDEKTGVNYLEKYNLEPSEVTEVLEKEQPSNDSAPIKSFKVSQVISPVYGVKKEVINSDKF